MRKRYNHLVVAMLLCLSYNSILAINSFPYSIRFDELDWHYEFNEIKQEEVIIVDYQGWTVNKWAYDPTVTLPWELFKPGIVNSNIDGYIVSPLLDLANTNDPYLTFYAKGDLKIYLSTSNQTEDDFKFTKAVSSSGFNSIKLDKSIKHIMISGIGEVNYVRVFDRSSHIVTDFPWNLRFDKLDSFIGWTGQEYTGLRIWDDIEGPFVLSFYTKSQESFIITPQLDLSSLKEPCITAINPKEMPNGYEGKCSLYTSSDGDNYTLLNTWNIDTKSFEKKGMPEFISIPSSTKFIKIHPHSDILSTSFDPYYIWDLKIQEMEFENVDHSDEINLQNSGSLKWESTGNSFSLASWQDATTGQASLVYNDESLETLSEGNYNLSFNVEGLDNSKIELFVDSKGMARSNNDLYYPDKDGLHTVSLSTNPNFAIVAKLIDGTSLNNIPNIVISAIALKTDLSSGVINQQTNDNICIHIDKKSEILHLSNISKGNYKTLIKISDLHGRTLLNKEIVDSEFNIQLENISDGIFILSVKNPEMSLNKKIIK